MPNQFLCQSWCRRFLLLCAMSLIFVAGICRADGDHDRARKALEAGEILPLSTILQQVERDYPGQVLDVELDRENDGRSERWIYKVKLLRTGGALVKLAVDGHDGTLISRRSKD